MVGELDREYVEMMSLPTLFDRIASVRRVDSARALNAFYRNVAAARSDGEGIRLVGNALAGVANLPEIPDQVGGHGDVDDLHRWLAGGV